MANPEDNSTTSEPAAAASSEPRPAGETAKPEATKADAAAGAASGKTAYLQPYTGETAQAAASDQAPRPRLRQYAPLAASLALSAALGGLAGAAANTLLSNEEPSTAAVNATSANRALRDTVTKLEGEIATLRTAITSAQRTTGTQIGKLSERVDRAEKAQAEPATKLAKIMESIDRLEHRAPPAQQAAAPVTQPAPDVTGSVAAKQDAKPPLADGWRLLDVYGNHVVVENRSGRLFEVAPGSNLPGLGRVETIKREDGKVMVVTRNGIIAASIEPRRRSGFLPRYFSLD